MAEQVDRAQDNASNMGLIMPGICMMLFNFQITSRSSCNVFAALN